MLVDSYFILFISLYFVFNSLPEGSVTLNILLYKNHYVWNILTRITTILLTVFTIKQLPVLEISQL